MSTFGTFFVPGPTEVRPDILAAMTRPMIAHRGKDFEALFARVQDGLRYVFRTRRSVYVTASSATGLMEAAVRCAPPGPILALVNGAFSQRIAEIAEACGRVTERIEVPWGDVVDPADAERALARKAYAAVAVVHSETSTGALSDVRAVADAAHRHGALALVDSVSGLGGAPLDTDAWNLDFVFTGSQKALAAPPGLAFAAASEAYLSGAQQTEARGRYLDVVELDAFARRGTTPATPAVSLLYAMEAQLDTIRREGLEARWARHDAMRARVEQWAAHRGVPPLAPPAARSPTVTALVVGPGRNGTDLVRAVGRRGLVIGAGYDKLKDMTVRIGHMGEHTVAGVERCLMALDEALDPTAPLVLAAERDGRNGTDNT